MQQEIKSQTHTPGPWMIGRHLLTEMPHIRSSTTDIADCCEASRRPIEWEANARLIAAAPDLLAALELVTKSSFYGDTSGYHHVSHEAIMAVREAVTKATGI